VNSRYNDRQTYDASESREAAYEHRQRMTAKNPPMASAGPSQPLHKSALEAELEERFIERPLSDDFTSVVVVTDLATGLVQHFVNSFEGGQRAMAWKIERLR